MLQQGGEVKSSSSYDDMHPSTVRVPEWVWAIASELSSIDGITPAERFASLCIAWGERERDHATVVHRALSSQQARQSDRKP